MYPIELLNIKVKFIIFKWHNKETLSYIWIGKKLFLFLFFFFFFMHILIYYCLLYDHLPLNVKLLFLFFFILLWEELLNFITYYNNNYWIFIKISCALFVLAVFTFLGLSLLIFYRFSFYFYYNCMQIYFS